MCFMQMIRKDVKLMKNKAYIVANEQQEQAMQEWLHPETIKIVDE